MPRSGETSQVPRVPSVPMNSTWAAGAFRFSRKLVQRVDEAGSDLLGGVEKLVSGAIKSARETTHAAQDLANTATAGVTGHNAQA